MSVELVATELSILFVCLGNICRSPAAHAIMQTKVAQAHLACSVMIDSAGTATYHTGSAPDKRMQQVCAEYRYNLSHLQARQVDVSDFYRFDYIFAMDESNLQDLQVERPDNATARIGLLLHVGEIPQANQFHYQVPDPYYGGTNGFVTVIRLLETATDILIDKLRNNQPLI